ncbi:hypothetical protein [Facilibium subflavum]|nr:hypothetical protein [Facilibium subflavum]
MITFCFGQQHVFHVFGLIAMAIDIRYGNRNLLSAFCLCCYHSK